MKLNKKYIETVDELKLIAFNNDDNLLELSTELLFSKDLHTDSESEKFLSDTLSDQTSPVYKNFQNILNDDVKCFFVKYNGLKIILLTVSIKNNETDKLSNFVVSKRFIIEDFKNKKLKNKIFQVNYSIDNLTWTRKYLRAFGNCSTIIHNETFFYKLLFSKDVNKFRVLHVDFTKDNYLINLSFLYKDRYYTLSDLRKEYSELSNFFIKVPSIYKFSIGSKKMRELFKILELILI